MESRQLFQITLPLIRYIETGRVLTFWSPDAFRHIFWSGLQAVEYKLILAGFWRSQVSRHRLGGTGRRNMLE